MHLSIKHGSILKQLGSVDCLLCREIFNFRYFRLSKAFYCMLFYFRMPFFFRFTSTSRIFHLTLKMAKKDENVKAAFCEKTGNEFTLLEIFIVIFQSFHLPSRQ